VLLAIEVTVADPERFRRLSLPVSGRIAIENPDRPIARASWISHY
jgi:hypothetical protein